MSRSVNTVEETPLNGNKCSSDAEEIELQVSNQRKEEKQVSAEKDGKIVWRIANGLMTAFFFMAAGVQFNDPDPYLWVPLYGIAALLTLSITIWPNSSGNKKWIWIYWIHAVYCSVIFFYVIIELVMAATNPLSDGSLNPLTYEEGREMAGVMITAVWLFTCKQSPTIRCVFPLWCECCTSRPPKRSSNFVDNCQPVWQDSEVL